jgi:glycosyltransferase involved in cell wall biosynthesis
MTLSGRPGLCDPGLATEVGYEDLGPIFLKWAWLTHVHLASMEPPAKALFASRAGLRMKTLYEAFLASRSWSPPIPIDALWTSRLLAFKAALPGATSEVMRLAVNEYHDRSLGDLVQGLMRHEPDWLSRIPDHRDLRLSATALEAVLGDRDNPLGRLLLEYGRFYNREYRRYLEATVGDAGRVAIVDSGWQGTVHALLSLSIPDVQLVSVLAAKSVRSGGLRYHLPDVVGLLMESGQQETRTPLTALIHHRHLLENLFETPGDSVEYLVVTDGEVDFPQADPNLAPPDPSRVGDAHLIGVLNYVRDNAAQPPHRILSESDIAEHRLARRILYPGRDDLHSLMVPARSADFGRKTAVEVCIDPQSDEGGSESESEARARRLDSSLWYQGQLLLEYDQSVARGLMKIAAEGFDPDAYFQAPRAGIPEEVRPSVAVITRTKDRPILFRRAAASVAAQTFSNYSWVVVNDGGDVETVLDVIERCAVPPDRITMVSNSSSVGMESASNLGVAAVQSDYVVIHDDDDSWDPSFLEQTVSFLSGPVGAKYGGVITHAIYVSESIDGNAVVTHERRPYNDWVQHVQLAEMAVGNFFPPISYVFRRSVWEAIGGFNEALPVLGDWDFNLRALAHADIAVIPEELAYYHHRDRDEPSAYGNSVVAGSDKHAEYSAIFRNDLLRAGGSDTLAMAAAVGYALKTLRSDVRSASSGARPRIPGSSDTLTTDDYWIALHQAFRVGRRRALRLLINPQRNSARDEDVMRLVRDADFRRIPVHPDFDDETYLQSNTDVAQAVRAGTYSSGYHHFIKWGRSEGRPRPTLQ